MEKQRKAIEDDNLVLIKIANENGFHKCSKCLQWKTSNHEKCHVCLKDSCDDCAETLICNIVSSVVIAVVKNVEMKEWVG